MLDSLSLVSKQVGVLFALMVVGFLCNRRKLLNAIAIKGITELLVLIVTPCVIVHSFILQKFAASLLGDLGWALAMSVFAHAVGAAIAFLCLHDRDPNRGGVLRFAVIFSNAGFMGIPLEYALLGADGVFFGAMYVVVFNLVCWSLGVAVMCRGMKNVGLRALFVNAGTVGVTLGLPFFLFSLKLPEVLGRPVAMLADLNTPLAMIMTGWYLADADFRPVLRCAAAYLAGFLRLVAVPAAVIGGMWLLREAGFQLDSTMCAAIATATAAPVAALTTVIAARLDGDVSTATGLVSGTTLVSMFTMPPVVGFALCLFGAG